MNTVTSEWDLAEAKRIVLAMPGSHPARVYLKELVAISGLTDVERLAASSPKSVIRASHETGLLSESDSRQALAMVNGRNLTSHTYNKQLAKTIAGRISGHYIMLEKWLLAVTNNLAKRK